ncbi:MAG: ankyrin repeat domain-containing protein [Bacteroidales bacterium]|nr:ankyrin repeat domain-containing protein [Bacteroidales bacterium]MCF8345246.1 ankyrin repeat domain-containing protein [Bacteroidales bacterium]MCF8351353.1 ankyrin repeat domain-containing protein [Bacteroidales bacterium]MCF8377639.1 ankyrin repeat domain-containing protein [Bacteroidales bacterium]
MKNIKKLLLLSIIFFMTLPDYGQGVSEAMGAIYMKDYEKAKEIINSGIDVNESDRGSYLLHVACFRGNPEIVKLLIYKGADIHQVAGDGATPIVHAGHGDTTGEIVQLLIDQGASVDHEDKSGATAFRNAVYGILSSKENRSFEPMEILLENGADVDHRVPEGDAKGYTTLMSAVGWNNKDLTEFLIEHGADVNNVAADGMTPLMVAADEGNLELVKLLVEEGAKIDVANKKDETPIRIAMQDGHTEVVNYLESIKN